MRPKLKIGPLTHLQDARSSAAVGFDLLSFSLERGNHRKLAPSMVWNIINWIQGPQILLALNADSLEELAETEKMFPAQVISFPLKDWKEGLVETEADLFVKASTADTPEHIAEIIKKAEAAGYQVKVEVSLEEISEIGPYRPLFDKLFLHFTEASVLFEFLKSESELPYGFSLGDEFREDAEFLDYERIDELMEMLEDLFPEG